MNISKVEAFQIETPRYYGQISGHVIIKVHTDEGPTGLGEASDSRAENLQAILDQYNKLLTGRDPTRITEINELLLAHDFKSSVTNVHLASAIDLALYDLNGKVQGVPAYVLLGGKVRERIYCCYPIFGFQVMEDFERTIGYLQRLVDLGHHLYRYYVSGDSALDVRFLTEVNERYGNLLKLKSLDLQGRFNDWESAMRYAEVIRPFNPYHFEQPSNSLRVSAEFTKRFDLPVSLHIGDQTRGYEAIERGSCTVFNLACVFGGPTNIRKLFSLAEAAGIKCLIGTDQESTLGTSAQVQLGVSMPNLDLPCDPMGPVLYTESLAVERIRAEGSYLYPPEGPGLGVALDEDRVKALKVN